MKNIAVIGCGQLGCRHIQGLGRSRHRIKVHVFDISKNSLDNCKAFVSDIAKEIDNLEFVFFNNLELIGSSVFQYDLIIVASTAYQRSLFLRQLVSLTQSRHWLIEKPLSQSPKELDELDMLLPKNGVWINHIRRLSTTHQMFLTIFSEKNINKITVTGPNIGIGCNISHFVDLVNYWTSQIPIFVDVSGLEAEWHKSHRPGFMEIDGTIKITFSGGLNLFVVSDGVFTDRIIEGEYDNQLVFSINETSGTATINDVKSNHDNIPFQSELTGLVFDELDLTDKSALTPLDVASRCYRPIIKALLEHWMSTSRGSQSKTVPLT